MSNARNLARLLPNASGQLPDANLAAIAAGKVSGQLADANMASGSVLQVVQYQFTGDFTTSSSSFVDVTGFQATITPSSNTSKVLVTVSTTSLHTSASASQGEYKVLRNGVDFAGIASGRMWSSDGYYGSGTNNDLHMTFLDSPASTSALTYKLQIRNRHSQSMNIGRDWNNDLAGLHTIILTEIAG